MKQHYNRKIKNGVLRMLCAFCLSWVAMLASAQVSVEATIDSLQLLIGEQTRIRLEVSLDAKEPLSLPLLRDTLVKGVEIVEVAKPDTQLLNNGKRWLVSQEYTVMSFDSALYYLPPFEVKVGGQSYRSKALALKVYSVPVDTLHPDQFFGPKNIREVPLTWNDVSVLVYAVVALLLLGALAVFLVIRFRNNKPIIKIIKLQPKLPPHLAAIRQMEQLKADKGVRYADPKRYYTELTDVIRTYIKERFGFNALEMTSAEILDRLLQEKDKSSIADLKRLLETADLVKFAKYAPLMNENDMNLVNAIGFINDTKIEEDPAAKKEPTEIRVEEKRSKQGRIALMASIALTAAGAVAALYVAVRQLIDLFF